MELMVIFAGAFLLMVPIAFFMALGNRNEQKSLRLDLRDVNKRMQRFDKRLHNIEAHGVREKQEPDQSHEAAATTAKETEKIQRQHESSGLEYGKKVEKHMPAPASSEPSSPPEKIVRSVSKPARGFAEVEQDLSSKWMIWIGGIALALGGGFLVKYSIDAGLLAPAVRVTLGTVFGLLLLVGGETLRRRSLSIDWLKDAPEYLPSAVSAAGLFTLFASLYGAYGLYELLSPFWAFLLLAAVSLIAVLLAQAHGKFFAYLGMVAGMAVPVLVSTGGGSAWALFPYLLFIIGVTLFVAREKSWSDVAGYTLLMAVSWVFLWIATNWSTGDVAPVGLYLLIVGGLNTWLLSGATPEQNTDARFVGMEPKHAVSKISAAVTLVGFVLLVGMIRLEHYSVISIGFFALAVGGQIYSALRSPEHDLGVVSAIVASLFLLATWHVPDLIEMQNYIGSNEAMHFAMSPIAPPGFEKFVTAAVLLGGVFGFGIYFALPWLLRKPMWATIGAAYTVIVLIIAYGRLNDFETSIPFAAIALAVAGVYTLAIRSLNKFDGEFTDTTVAAYAAGATTVMALAFTMVLRDAWLTTALGFEVVALAHIWRKIPVKGLRQLALGLAAITLVRLFLNASIFDYSAGEPLAAINWLFYGYGLTAVFFVYAARIFDQGVVDDKLISLLKAGGVLLAVSFFTLEIRVLFGEDGRLLGGLTATEAAMQTLNWSVATTILMWRELKDNNKLFGVLRKFMTLASLFGLVVLGGMYNNILFGAVKVGTWPIFNLQLIQFLVPGLLFALKARMADVAGRENSQLLYGLVALVTIFVWVTAEVRLFHSAGENIPPSNWEWYSYSAAWLFYAVGLISAGIKLTEPRLRLAGMAVLGLVVLKVFLFDMSHLDGVARALSFMGLGGALIGLGYLYQFFKQDDADEEDPVDQSNQLKL